MFKFTAFKRHAMNIKMKSGVLIWFSEYDSKNLLNHQNMEKSVKLRDLKWRDFT